MPRNSSLQDLSASIPSVYESTISLNGFLHVPPPTEDEVNFQSQVEYEAKEDNEYEGKVSRQKPYKDFNNRTKIPPLLKNVYPSGFNTNASRDPMEEKLKAYLRTTDAATGDGKPSSFMSWTTGQKVQEEVEDQTKDAFADVAGPFFFDRSGPLVDNRRLAAIKNLQLPANTEKQEKKTSIAKASHSSRREFLKRKEPKVTIYQELPVFPSMSSPSRCPPSSAMSPASFSPENIPLLHPWGDYEALGQPHRELKPNGGIGFNATKPIPKTPLSAPIPVRRRDLTASDDLEEGDINGDVVLVVKSPRPSDLDLSEPDGAIPSNLNSQVLTDPNSLYHAPSLNSMGYNMTVSMHEVPPATKLVTMNEFMTATNGANSTLIPNSFPQYLKLEIISFRDTVQLCEVNRMKSSRVNVLYNATWGDMYHSLKESFGVRPSSVIIQPAPQVKYSRNCESFKATPVQIIVPPTVEIGVPIEDIDYTPQAIIDPIFVRYFQYSSSCWCPLNKELDWERCKLISLQNHASIKMMVGLKKDEHKCSFQTAACMATDELSVENERKATETAMTGLNEFSSSTNAAIGGQGLHGISAFNDSIGSEIGSEGEWSLTQQYKPSSLLNTLAPNMEQLKKRVIKSHARRNDRLLNRTKSNASMNGMSTANSSTVKELPPMETLYDAGNTRKTVGRLHKRQLHNNTRAARAIREAGPPSNLQPNLPVVPEPLLSNVYTYPREVELNKCPDKLDSMARVLESRLMVSSWQ